MSEITSNNVARAIVKLVAAYVLPELATRLSVALVVPADYEPVVAQLNDTVTVGDTPIVLDTRVVSTFQIPDVIKVLAVPDLLPLYMEPAVATIAHKIENDLLSLFARARVDSSSSVGSSSEVTFSDIGLAMRRLPQPPGVITEYAEMGNFGMQVVMNYQPNTLTQQFTLEVLYGCGVLVNAAGAQVNT